MATTDPEALEVVQFWRDAGREKWFAKDARFDADFHNRFLALHEQAAAGKLDHWIETPEGALALLLLLDQFPRNCFRGTKRVYETDPKARQIARRALAAKLDEGVEKPLGLFFYLPFAHSEDLADQKISVEKSLALGGEYVEHAQGHHDIVERFGRFPHRNAIFGRKSTAEEEAFLADGGFSG